MPARILIVEDENIVSLDVQDRLTAMDYEVVGVANRGEAALSYIETHHPDLVLMDIQLKGAMDGITVAEVIRQRWRIPVIFLTAYSEDQTLQRAKLTEPFGYIIKPFDDREIHSVIEMALYKHQTEQRLRESERRYATTLKSIGDGVIATDPQGRVTFLNPVAEALTGWPLADTLGRPLPEVFNIINEQTRHPVENPVARVLRENVVVGLANHTILVSRSGREFPIDDSAAPILDDAGVITGTVLVFQDVTERRQKEHAHHQSEAQLHQVWESSKDGLRLTDEQGLMVRVNKAFCDLVGKTREQLLGQSLVTMYATEERDHLLQQYQERCAHRTLSPFMERKLRLWNGKELWFAVSNAFLDPNSSKLKVLSVFRDVTEHHLTEEALQKRVLALTQPLDNPVGIQFSDLFNAEDLQHLQDAFSEATGVASIITHPDGTPITRPSNFCRLCSEIIRKTKQGQINCFKSDAALGCQNPAGPTVQPCLSGGLWDAGASITVGGQHVANWLIGQVRNEALDENQMLCYADDIGANREDFKKALAEVPVMSKVQFGKVANALFAFANELSLKAYQNVQQARFIAERKRTEEERLELERRLLHAQKLESLGVLAGGIAHDFNNLLTAIVGNIELAKMDISEYSPARECLSEAALATRRAADLTRQMLAYSGRGKFFIQELDLSALVQEMTQLLKVSITKTVTLLVQLERSLPRIYADGTQMQQIVMNLITNASEAIGERVGCITITTGVQDCDPAYLAQSRLSEKVSPGRYVYLSVADTGCGMDEAVQQRLFDPFFTTKFTGRGLGMSAVLGVVRGHKGAILIDSEVGRGTTIRVLFPVSHLENPANDGLLTVTPNQPSVSANIGSTILVVDDEEAVRKLAVTTLERKGFRVLNATDGVEAIEMFQKESGTIACVLLDLTMPRMDGIQTFAELRRLRPNIPVLLASGFSEHELSQRYAGQGLAGFIQKPYSLDEMVQTVQRACQIHPSAKT
jgi:PAS domain S-box-containing protein